MPAQNPIDEITPELVLRAYAYGIFPMAESADDPALFWVEPKLRGIIPLDTFHVPRRLARTVRSGHFDVRFDTDFEGVISGCAATRPDADATWINSTIRELYGALFRTGHVHTVETWRDDKLVGGLYGVHLGSVFFGESMFSFERDASKVALVKLVERLQAQGFKLLDTQFVTEHLSQFGAVEIPRHEYQRRLRKALAAESDF